VGSFLVVIPALGKTDEARLLFLDALDAAREIRSQGPAKTVQTEWSCAATFARHNSTGGTLASDAKTGSWLLAAGTWFHQDGFASGSESKLLQRYLETGASQLGKELDGFFVLVIGDARTHEVIVLTDIVGSCHAFRRSLSQGTVLSGSSLLLASLHDCELDPLGAQEFLSTGIVYEDRTCYREIRKLAPATVLRFSARKTEATRRYWAASDLQPGSLKGDVAVDSMWSSLKNAAARIAKVYRDPVCDLTGGYDSRALLAALRGAGVECAATVYGAPDSADVVVSKGLAKDLGLPHVHFEPSDMGSFPSLSRSLSLTDGEYDLVNYSQIRDVHERLAESYSASLNGSFGELARGYWWELVFPFIGARRRLNAGKVAARRYGAAAFDNSIYPARDRVDMPEHFVGVIERSNAGLFDFPNTFQMDHAYLVMRMQRWQGRIASATNQLWPCLSPFMFRSVLETMLQARALTRWRSLLIRKMLTKFAPRIANYPLEHGFPAAAANIGNFYRFAPLIPYFAKKVSRRVGVNLNARGASPTGGAGTASQSRLHLYQDEELRDVLRPAEMKLGGWLEPDALKNFLSRSREPDFRYGDQWARMLSLECALREAARVRRLHKDSPSHTKDASTASATR